MAEIAQDNGGGKGKKHQKKMTIRVDFTPMVDMNMLLITFFMLCTTMIKSQTLNIALPSNEKVENEENMSQASAEDAVTIILDAKRKPGSFDVDTINGKVSTLIYYYEGKPGNGEADPTGPNNNLKVSEFKNNEGGLAQGIRSIIQGKNKEVLAKINVEKERFKNGQITQEEFNELAKKIRNDSTLKKPTIIIKSTPQASYGSLVSILDEMQINNIAKYQIDNMTKNDSAMLIDYQNRHR